MKKSTLEEYKLRSLGRDINDMSGRNKRPDLTKYISRRILSLIPDAKGNLVDIGCGEGSFLRMAHSQNRFDNITGILPTDEEISRLRRNLEEINLEKHIKLKKGLVEKNTLENDFYDVVVVNGVLLLLDDIFTHLFFLLIWRV